MPEKKPFITLEQAQEIIADVPTPFHLYDEKGIRANARLVNKAFAWNKGFKEYFAVKATPNPYLLRILKEEGCGVDCSSYTELLLSEACGFSGSDIMFSSNETPVQDMKKAYDLGAYINLDDLTHVDFLKNVAGIPETICCRFRYMVPSPMQIPSIMRNTEQGFYLVRSGKRNTDLLPEAKKACPRKFRQTPESVSGISWKMLPAMSFCGRRCFITAPTGFRKNWTNVCKY